MPAFKKYGSRKFSILLLTVMTVFGLVTAQRPDDGPTVGRPDTTIDRDPDPCTPIDCAPGNRKGLYSHPNSCTKYFECTGARRHNRECPTGETFSHDLRQCMPDHECEIPCSVTFCGETFDCRTNTEPIRTHPTDCGKYLQCDKDQLRIQDCPRGERFHSERLQCAPEAVVICPVCARPPIDNGPLPTPSAGGTDAATDSNLPDATTAGTVAIGPKMTTVAPVTEQPTLPASDQTTVDSAQVQTSQAKGPDAQLTTAEPNNAVTAEPQGPPSATTTVAPITTAAGITTKAARKTTVTPIIDPSQGDIKPPKFEFDLPTTAKKTTTVTDTGSTSTTMPTLPITADEMTQGSSDRTTFNGEPTTDAVEPVGPTTEGSMDASTTEHVKTTGNEEHTSDRSTPKQTDGTTVPGSTQNAENTPGLTTDAVTQQSTAAGIDTTEYSNPTTTAGPPEPATAPVETTQTSVEPTKPSKIEPTTRPVKTTLVTTEVTTEPTPVHFIETSSTEFSEGDTATFKCIATLPANYLLENNIAQPKPLLVWTLSSNTLIEGGRLTINTVDEFATRETISSSLTIKDIRSRDSGQLRCIIESEGKVISESEDYYLAVVARPTVKLSVTRDFVPPGQTIEATCSVLVPPTGSPTPIPEPTVYWYKDGVFLGMSERGKIFMGLMVDEEDQVRIDDLGYSQLSIKVRERLTLSCSATNSAGSSDIASKIVNVVQLGEQNLSCEKEVLRGITWPPVLAGGEAYEGCQPLNAKGQARRECVKVSNVTVQWKDPDYTECVTEEYAKTFRRINKVGDTLGPVNTTVLTDTAKDLEDLTDAPEPILPGDVKTTVEVIDKLVEIRKDWGIDEPVPEEEVVAITQTISNLLSDENIDSWDNFEEDKSYVSVGLMKAMDSYAELLAEDMMPGEDKLISTKNVLLMIESMSKDHTVTVQFPKNSSKISTQAWARDTKDYIMVQRDTMEYIKDDVQGDTLVVSGAYYNNLNKILPAGESAGVNSRVLAMTIHGLNADAKMAPPVAMRFTLQKKYPSDMTNECSFWNYTIPSKGAWSRVGCAAVATDDNSVTCECSHLTNFAMLVSAGPVSDQHYYILSMISLVGCIISMVALLLTLFFYCSMWKAVKSHHAAVLINLCIALVIGNLLFIAGVERTENEMVCTTIAVLLHYFWLAAFFIMMVEGIQLLLYIIYVFHVRRKRDTAALLVAGWVVPAVIVGTTLAVTQLEGYGNDEVCWLSPESGLLWAFVGPVLCVIAVNMVILIIVLKRALSAKIPTNNAKKKNKLRSAVWNILVITPLLGITWVVGVFSVNEDTIAFQYVFAVSNSLQGLFIFIFHALCNKKKGRYTLRGETTPSNQKKTQSGSAPKTTSTAPQSRKSSKSSGLSGPTNGYAANGHAHRSLANNGRSRSSITMDLHSPPTVTTNGHTSNVSSFIPDARVSRNESYSSGKKPSFNQQLSEGSDMGSDIVLPAPSPPGKEASPLENNNAGGGAGARVSTVSSTIPPSPTTTTTDVSWTSEPVSDIERDLIIRSTSVTSA